MSDPALAQELLRHISPSDNETRYRVAAALYDGLGDGGYGLFDGWLQGHERYRAELRSWGASQWRSLKNGRPSRPVTFGTLVYLAKANGWRGEAPKPQAPSAAERAAKWARRQEAAAERQRAVAGAKAKATAMLKGATLTDHPYLARKGFPEEQAFVADGLLLVPIRDIQFGKRSGELRSVQTIAEDGTKRYLYGTALDGGGIALGDPFPDEIWYVEGYATALSVREALRSLPSPGGWSVVATMSAGGMAKESRKRWPARRAYVIADHDDWLCASRDAHGSTPYRWVTPPGIDVDGCPVCGSADQLKRPAGERAARQSGLPWWVPPERGDANDLHQRGGLEQLRRAIFDLRTRR